MTKKNSFLKSFVWRCMGVVILATITYIFTQKWLTTTYITFAHHATFLLVFFLHERFWLRLKRPVHWIKPWTYEVILGMGIGGLIVYFFTGSWIKVGAITGTYTVVKIITYYIFDRWWYKRFKV